jgi:hypothetical protein
MDHLKEVLEEDIRGLQVLKDFKTNLGRERGKVMILLEIFLKNLKSFSVEDREVEEQRERRLHLRQKEKIFWFQ